MTHRYQHRQWQRPIKDWPKGKPRPPEPEISMVTIEGNPQREQLVIKADPKNKEAIWLGEPEQGLPLLAGEERTLSIQGDAVLSGQKNDRVYLAQLLREEVR